MKHEVGTREEWLAARIDLLEREELTRRSDELVRQRQQLPWVPVDKEYTFETDEGTKTLVGLFDGRSQLLVYHFMFGPTVDGWPEAGCPGCSYTADSLDGALVHLEHCDVTFVATSRAPLEKLDAYKRRMGWSFPWVSSEGSDFNLDFAVFTEEGRRAGSGRPERLRPRGRRRLPHVLDLRPWHRRAERHLAAARPGPEGARRGLRRLAAPS